MSNICLPCSRVTNNSIKEYAMYLNDLGEGEKYFVYIVRGEDWQTCTRSSFNEIHKKNNKKKGYEYYKVSEFRRD